MTAGTSTPHRSGPRTGHDGFAQLLRAERTKFRTVRGWVIGTRQGSAYAALLVTAALLAVAAVLALAVAFFLLRRRDA